MLMFEYMNPHPRPIEVKGPNGEKIVFRQYEKKVLSEEYKKYCPRLLVALGRVNRPKSISPRAKVSIVKKQPNTPERRAAVARARSRTVSKNKPEIRPSRRRTTSAQRSIHRSTPKKPDRDIAHKNIATQYFQKLLDKVRFPVSDETGVGILSYNRLKCIQRLIRSIRAHTDLSKTTIFVSDESDKREVKEWLRQQKDIVLIDSNKRLGVAGNTNRLLRCLDRFKYKILLNDDVELLRRGWDQIYPIVMRDTGYHHFCMRQPGVYGATRTEGNIKTIDEVGIQTIDTKPHGAVMAFDAVAQDTVGYFDERFGIYGIEHVDWSNRVALSGIQPPGYHDAVGSEQFFRIHNESSAVSGRNKLFREARDKFASMKGNKSRIYVKPSVRTRVPEICFVVPFQGKDRLRILNTLLKNLKIQKFPRIEIIISEQGNTAEIEQYGSIRHIRNNVKGQFNKAILLNDGVVESSCAIVVLHDADLLVSDDYSTKIMGLMDDFDACHLCDNVIYFDKSSSEWILESGAVKNSLEAIRLKGDIQGSSIAIKKKPYFMAGGYCERFKGNGWGDEELYSRLSTLTNFFDGTSVDFLHLHHDRADNYDTQREANKKIFDELERTIARRRCTQLLDNLKKRLGKKLTKLL